MQLLNANWNNPSHQKPIKHTLITSERMSLIVKVKKYLLLAREKPYICVMYVISSTVEWWNYTDGDFRVQMLSLPFRQYNYSTAWHYYHYGKILLLWTMRSYYVRSPYEVVLLIANHRLLFLNKQQQSLSVGDTLALHFVLIATVLTTGNIRAKIFKMFACIWWYDRKMRKYSWYRVLLDRRLPIH